MLLPLALCWTASLGAAAAPPPPFHPKPPPYPALPDHTAGQRAATTLAASIAAKASPVRQASPPAPLRILQAGSMSLANAAAVPGAHRRRGRR